MFYHLVQQPEAPQALDGAPKPPEALPVFECISDPATARAIVESEDVFEFDGKGGFTLVSSPVARPWTRKAARPTPLTSRRSPTRRYAGSTERNPATYRGHLRPKERSEAWQRMSLRSTSRRPT